MSSGPNHVDTVQLLGERESAIEASSEQGVAGLNEGSVMCVIFYHAKKDAPICLNWQVRWRL